MLEARGVSLSLCGAKILDGVTVEAPPGEVLALCGPNGAGKSSLLSILSGERAPDLGEAALDGRCFRRMRPLEMAQRRAVLEQNPATDLAFSVRELALLGAAPAGPDSAFDEQAAALVAMHRAGVASLAHRAVGALSGGERHRAHFARVLVQVAAGRSEGGGRALLLDEPTASLDLSHQVSLLRCVRGVAQDGVAVVVVLHDLTLAAAFSDRIALLASGRVTAVGAPSEVLTSERLTEIYGVEIVVDQDSSGRPLVRPVFPHDQKGVAECISL